MLETDYPPYLEPLNPEQRAAVLHTGKPLLILAGAGSGKTRVITTKIAWLIREKGVDPRSILAVTFTNKAAREMADRAKAIDERAGNAMLRTFHSFGAWFLRRNGSFAGLDSSFVIYDDDDTMALLSAIMENSPKAEVKEFAYHISRAKDYFLSPDDPLLARIDSRKKFRDIYMRYEERLAQIGNVDFGDLIKKPVEILRSQPEVANRFRERFSVIMVDEYQDANVAQFQLLKELCGDRTYVCVVGDDDQSIYRFRGAEVKNILEFPDRFCGADIIRLERNYRSTAPILKAASSVVNYNRGRLGKTLLAERGKGPLPVLAYLPDQDEEAAFCANTIMNSVMRKETAWSDWAVLYRINAQSLGFETQFLRRKIPYKIVGSLKFYEREEIKDALALLSLLINPRDEVAFRRVVNKPVRGVGAATIDKIIEASERYGGNLLETGGEITLSPKAQSGLKKFTKAINDGRALLGSAAADIAASSASDAARTAMEADENAANSDKNIQKKKKPAKKQKGLKAGAGLAFCVTQIVRDSGIAEYHENHDEDTGNTKLNNLQELVNAASIYALSREGLVDFLEHIELDRSLVDDSKSGNSEDRVTFITFHNTKGLEFRRVIMTGLEQGIFPREDKKSEDLEEERRLFYVGATRAMDELYFTSCATRRMYGRTMQMQPSLFLRELDRKCLKICNNERSYMQRPAVLYKKKVPVTMPKMVPDTEKICGYVRGQRIYNENFGYGAVMDVKDSDDGPVVRVRFDNGNETRFLSEHQGRAYEKVEDDY